MRPHECHDPWCREQTAGLRRRIELLEASLRANEGDVEDTQPVRVVSHVSSPWPWVLLALILLAFAAAGVVVFGYLPNLWSNNG